MFNGIAFQLVVRGLDPRTHHKHRLKMRWIAGSTLAIAGAIARPAMTSLRFE
jgi:hypothetical protein